MPEIPVKAFLSCSLAAEDREVVDLIKKLLAALHITPEIQVWQDVGRLTPEIEDRIKATDCVVAIATKRYPIENSDEFTFSDWVHDEITMARSFGKPVVLFLEKGVRIGGSLAEVRRHVFLEGRPAGRRRCNGGVPFQSEEPCGPNHEPSILVGQPQTFSRSHPYT
jgi:hypothetical protein